MLADLFMTPGKGVIDEVIVDTTKEAGRYGISSPAVDRRRAYQVARMVVPNRHGDHLPDLTPDAYNAFSPTTCAKSHSGKKKIDAPAERRAKYVHHPQTLAYVMTPASGSAPGTIAGVDMGEAAPAAGVIAGGMQEQLGGKGGGAVDSFAKIVAALHAGPPQQAEEPAAA